MDLFWTAKYHYYYWCYQISLMKWKSSIFWNTLDTKGKAFTLLCSSGAVSGFCLTLWKFYSDGYLTFNSNNTIKLTSKRDWTKRLKRGLPPGLYNHSNICFANCTLQALASQISFTQWVYTKFYESTDKTLLAAIHDLMKVLTNEYGDEDVYAISDILSSLTSHGWVISSDQQDAHELFQILSSTLEEEAVAASAGASNEVINEAFDFSIAASHDIYSGVTGRVCRNFPALELTNSFDFPFKGMYANRMTCMTCGNINSVRFEAFDSVSLSLQYMSPHTTSLLGCLTQFVTPELVHNVDCDNCKSNGLENKRSFSKHLAFAKLPRCLCVQFQRTYYHPSGMPCKNTLFVQFPETLDMYPFSYSAFLAKEKWKQRASGANASSCLSTKPTLKGGIDMNISSSDRSSTYQCLYRLNAMVVHLGQANDGHFVTYRRNLNSDGWVSVSDEYVKTVSSPEVFSSSAYMLYYERVSTAVNK